MKHSERTSSVKSGRGTPNYGVCGYEKSKRKTPSYGAHGYVKTREEHPARRMAT